MFCCCLLDKLLRALHIRRQRSIVDSRLVTGIMWHIDMYCHIEIQDLLFEKW